jgi:AcrR family transcriptional regulator
MDYIVSVSEAEEHIRDSVQNRTKLRFCPLSANTMRRPAVPTKRIKDRRIERTRNLLHEALVSLIRQKEYDQIVVKEILDRANVGRSTFYTHFRDKDDLLVSGIHHMLGSHRPIEKQTSGGTHEQIIAFSLPIFEHHYGHRQTGKGRIGPRGRALLHEHLQRVLAERLDGDIREVLKGHRKKLAGNVPPELVARYVASTFVLVLNWWLDCESLLPPRQIDGMFATLVVPTLTALWE